jgi:hypothetical protein
MPTDRDRKKGVIIMFCAATLFFGLVALFGLDGKMLDLRDERVFTEMIATAIPLPVGLYFGLYFYSGKKLANQLGGAALIVLVIGFIAAALGAHS